MNGIFPQADGSLLARHGSRSRALSTRCRHPAFFFPQTSSGCTTATFVWPTGGEPLLLGGNTLGSLHVFSPEGIRPFSWGPLREPTETVNALTPPCGTAASPSPPIRKGCSFSSPVTSLSSIGKRFGRGAHQTPSGPMREGRWLIANNLGTPDFRRALLHAPSKSTASPSRNTRWTCSTIRPDAFGSGTIGRGLFLRENGEWRHFGRRNGLRSNTIRALEEDSMGNIWIGTRLGLYRWHNGLYRRIRFEPMGDLRSEYILSLLRRCRRPSMDRHRARRCGICLKTEELRPIRAITGRPLPTAPSSLSTRIGKGAFGAECPGGYFLSRTNVSILSIYTNASTVDSVFHVMDDRLGSFWLTSFARPLARAL